MSEGVSRLRELLLDKERRELGDVVRKVDRLMANAVTRDRMQDSVAQVLAGALREAEGEQTSHNELASAISPLVLDTVRQEIRASADDLADQLHPHMGRMISAYVASAIKDMMAKMNARLESGLSPRRWAIKLKSIVTGRSEAELLLADMNTLQLQELFLIRRGSGELIQHWEAVGAGEVAGAPVELPAADQSGAKLRSNRDAVVSAFLTAINDFAREAFAASDGGLQTLDLQSHRIYLRSSPAYLLAAKCSGIPTPQTERLLDQEFARAIESHRNLLSTKLNGHQPAELQELLPGLALGMQKGLGPEADHPSGPNLSKWLLILLAAGLIGWLSWDKWMTWQTERTRAVVAAVLDNDAIMRSYVSSIDVERGGGGVRLKGLAPSPDKKTAVLGALQEALKPLGSIRIDDQIEVLPERGDGGVQSLKRDVRDSSAVAALTATQRAVQRIRFRIQQMSGELERLAREAPDATLRTALEGSARRMTAASGEVEDIWQVVTRGTAKDDMSALHPRLEGVLTVLRQTGAGMAQIRGDRPVAALERAQPGGERHDSVREDAELVAASADALWVEVTATERHLLRQTIAQLARRPTPAPVAASPRQELIEWTRGNAVFFSADATFRDAVESGRLFDGLAALLGRTDDTIRVVGYTDDLGTAQRNSGVSLDRANRVRQALVERGVAAQRLLVVGRPNGPNVSQSTGLNSPNRRVEFEVAFRREQGG